MGRTSNQTRAFPEERSTTPPAAKETLATVDPDAISGPEDIDLMNAKVIRRGARPGRRYTLQTLRQASGKTQAAIARAAEMDQGDVSRLEARGAECKISTLARYAKALGGALEVAIVIDGRRYTIDV